MKIIPSRFIKKVNQKHLISTSLIKIQPLNKGTAKNDNIKTKIKLPGYFPQ